MSEIKLGGNNINNINIGNYPASKITLSNETFFEPSYIFSNQVSWSDEFNYSGLPDPTKWGFDIGNGHFGWGNNELHYATDRIENSEVSDGKLKLIAKQESYNGFNYTSARLNTKSTKMFQYGRFVIRAKLPNSDGIWPAVFMFGENYQPYNLSSWPSAGEIDIFELAGSRPTIVSQSLHTETYHFGQDFQTNDTVVANVSTEFNNYRIDWTPEYIKYFINDVEVYEFLNDGTGHDGFPFNDYFNLLISLNVGGNYLGTGNPATVDNSSLPKVLEIEHVRYYELLGDYGTEPKTRIAAPVLTPSTVVTTASEVVMVSPGTIPSGKSVNWYGNGTLLMTNDFLYIPANSGYIGNFIITAVFVDSVTSDFSEPSILDLTISP